MVEGSSWEQSFSTQTQVQEFQMSLTQTLEHCPQISTSMQLASAQV